jgi:hypothetical protein
MNTEIIRRSPEIPPLRVFADTGHQYFTFPLTSLFPDTGDNTNEKWRSWLNKGKHLADPWKIWDIYPWVRYQYDIDEHDTPVIKIAVETNMGDPSNGLLCEIKERLASNLGKDRPFPYACEDHNLIAQNLGPERSVDLFSLPNNLNEDRQVNLRVMFVRPAGNDPVDVDLVVDLGNTRTVALLLESRGAADKGSFPFNRRVRALRFTPPGGNYDKNDKDCEIIPSWLLMHRTTFAALEPKLSNAALYDYYEKYQDQSGKELYRCKKFLPRSFIELSPAVIGGGKSLYGVARRFASVEMAGGGRYYSSSPKRYVWDDTQVGFQGGVCWKQVKNPTDPDFTMGGKLVEMDGLIRRYMSPDGVDWNIDKPPKGDAPLLTYAEQMPTYPRRDAVCWFALSLIETAYRQINSRRYLDLYQDDLPRRLRYIMVTYPAAWNHEAKQGYLDQWQRAINLFALTHFESSRHALVTDPTAERKGLRPKLLDTDVNEAICSQLPVLYSDIRTLFNKPKEWFDLYSNGGGPVVVMNVDIGGGTTDVTVIRYQLGRNDSLESFLLFQDGRSIAGDELVKKIIERFLIPAWIKAADENQYKDLPDAKRWLLSFFNEPSKPDFTDIDGMQNAPSKLARVIRLLFIPLVNQLLMRMVGLEGNPDLRLEPLDLEATSDGTQATPLTDLNDMASTIIRHKCVKGDRWKSNYQAFPVKGVRLGIAAADINRCIEDIFGPVCKSLGLVAAYFRCHLVIVTGKPSELPKLRRLVTESFPLLPQRIIHAHNFPAGRWYPFRPEDESVESGRIADAKSCTVVGAALYLDSLKNPHLNQFLSIQDQSRSGSGAADFKGRYYWGIVSNEGMGGAREFYEKRKRTPQGNWIGNCLFRPDDYKRPEVVEKDDMKYLDQEFELTINACRVGRQVLKIEKIRPEPVYELCFGTDLGEARVIQEPVRALVTLRWTLQKGAGESLKLMSWTLLDRVEALEGVPVRLRLNTMYESSFWLDDPQFDVDPSCL